MGPGGYPEARLEAPGGGFFPLPGGSGPGSASPRGGRSGNRGGLADKPPVTTSREEQGTGETAARPASALSPSALLGAPDRRAAPAAARPATPAPPAAAKTDWQTLAPRGFYARRGQRLLSFLCVLAGLPAALCVAAPIALANLILFRDPRKVFFLQPRVGQRGRVFRILKFRTMSEPRRSTFDSWSAGEDVSRVTRFGRFLRNAHLDELPQVYNILRGEMSLVGPRPEMIEIHTWAKEHVPGFERRLALVPGLTGRAQVTQGYAGRRVEAYKRKLAADDEYRIRFSLAEDLRILAMTASWVLRGRGWSWRALDEAQAAAQGADAEAQRDTG